MRMGVHHRLMTWCFIFTILLLLLAEIEASKNIEESNLDLNDRVSKIEAKDRQQDGKIAVLKSALDEERKLVYDLTNRVAILEGSNKIPGRPKRPVRLLPPHILRGKERNETDADDGNNQFRFYGPATGCNDLGRLGYTLNGLYLVHEKENKSTSSSSTNRQIEIVECRFRQKQKLGNQTDDKERRLGSIRLTNGNNGNIIQPSCLDVKGDLDLKEADNKNKVTNKTHVNIVKKADKERELELERIDDSHNIQPPLSLGKGNFGLKKADNKANEFEFTTRKKKIIKSSTTQPRSVKKPYCLYQWRSEMHKFSAPKKLMNLCLIAAERESKKNESIITTKEPEYYLGQSSCDTVKDEERWTIRNKHICGNKNDMCLTVSPNIKDGGVIVNLMAYEETAKSQQWMMKEYPSYTTTRYVIMTNIGTSLCLFEPLENHGKRKANTIAKACPTDYIHLNYLYYFEKVNVTNWKNCSPF